MKPDAKKKGYFEAASLTILPTTFDEKPTEEQFILAVSEHANLPVSSIEAKVPKNKDSKTAWVAFPTDTQGQHLFYACFPSTVKDKKCWAIGWSNKGTSEEMAKSIEAPELNRIEASGFKSSNSSSPFAALQSSMGSLPTSKDIYLRSCPQALANAGKPVVEAIWESTKGRPCSQRCKRPEGCKLNIYTP